MPTCEITRSFIIEIGLKAMTPYCHQTMPMISANSVQGCSMDSKLGLLDSWTEYATRAWIHKDDLFVQLPVVKEDYVMV